MRHVRHAPLAVIAIAIALSIAALSYGPAAVSTASNEPIAKSVVQIQEETRHSVIFILNYAKNPLGNLAAGKSAGSGFIVREGGELYAATNYHVVAGAEELWASVDDRAIPPFRLEVLGYSPLLDLALLKFSEKPSGLLPAKLGDSDALAADDPVVAIGSPLGIRFLATKGSVIKPDAMIATSAYSAYIISDVKVNPGNSGGPLFTSQGEVVGINAMISGPNPISFSIPVNHLAAVLPRLKLGGELKHAMMGASIQNSWELSPADYRISEVEPPKRTGVVVMAVNSGSPAAKAGVQAGDIILSVTLRGTTVVTPDTKTLMKLLLLRAIPDDDIVLLIGRGANQYYTAKLRLVERAAESE